MTRTDAPIQHGRPAVGIHAVVAGRQDSGRLVRLEDRHRSHVGCYGVIDRVTWASETPRRLEHVTKMFLGIGSAVAT
jgi:hypothetical protein